MALAALLHASVALALLATPLRDAQHALDAIEITMEPEPMPPPVETPPKMVEPPPVAAAQPRPPPPPVAAAQPPPPPPPPQPTVQPPSSLADSLPKGTTLDPRAAMVAPKVGAAEPEPTSQAPKGQDPTETQEAKEEPKPEPPKEVVKADAPQETVKPEPVPEQQMAALAPQPPPPPPPPKLEDALPPIEAPPPPLTSREIPTPPAPPPPAKPQPAPPQAHPPQAPPPPAPHTQAPQQQPAHSPLSRPTQPQQPGPGDTRQASRSPPSSFVNPADVYGQRKVEESYQALIMRQVQQRAIYSRATSEEGQVVVDVTVARDGRLIDARINRSSGYRTLDNAALEALRQSGPYPPLPSDIPGDRHTFPVRMGYRRNSM